MSDSNFGIYLIALRDRPIGEWLTYYDPDAGDLERTGLIDASADPAKALRFADLAAASEFLFQPSTRVPLRPDGAPNRPLRAFTVEIRRIP